MQQAACMPQQGRHSKGTHLVHLQPLSAGRAGGQHPRGRVAGCGRQAGGDSTHLLLHLAGAGGLQLAPLRDNRANHALLLQVLVAPVLAQLNNVVLALAPGVIEVNACTAAQRDDLEQWRTVLGPSEQRQQLVSAATAECGDQHSAAYPSSRAAGRWPCCRDAGSWLGAGGEFGKAPGGLGSF